MNLYQNITPKSNTPKSIQRDHFYKESNNQGEKNDTYSTSRSVNRLRRQGHR